MLPWERLRDKLLTVEGKPYAAYKSLEGAYRFNRFVLHLDYVHADPLGAPSLMRVRIDQAEAQFPKDLSSTRVRRVALEDYLVRRWHDAIRKLARAQRGPRTGGFSIDVGRQQILERTGCRVTEEYMEIRGGVVLPADGRKPTTKIAHTMLLEELPEIVESALLYSNQSAPAVQRHIDGTEDAEALRAQLRERGLVGFLADDAVLPRDLGSDRPVLSRLVTFKAPDALRVTLQAPHRGPVTGMGIPRGITVVLGGSFSGKSTLLRAIAAAVYNHAPGDGRDYCVTVADAVKVGTEEGRRVEGVDLRPFIVSLPTGDDLARFRSDHASALISQAAGILEALEAGSTLLLIDEDTTALPLLLRDPLWPRVVPEATELVTPLVDLLRSLYQEHGVSTIVATSVSGDYVDVADTIIAMHGFRPRVVTAEAKQVMAALETRRAPPIKRIGGIARRVPLPETVGGFRGRKLRAELQGARTVMVGREVLDLERLEQLVEPSQAKAVADALVFAADQGFVDGTRTLAEVVALVEEEIARRGLEVLSPYEGHPGDYAFPRRQEIAAALNRLKTLRVKDATPFQEARERPPGV